MSVTSGGTTLAERPDSRALPGGWAGALAWSDAAPWLAWTACHDPEPALLTYARQEWPLRPGRTLTEWRRRSAGVHFTLSLARLDDPSAHAVRELASSRHVIEGPALAPLPQQTTPAVIWAERRDNRCRLMAAIAGGRPEVIHAAAGAILAPQAAVDHTGRLWAIWQQWPEAASSPAARPRIVAAHRPLAVTTRDPPSWSKPTSLFPAGQSAWTPSLSAAPDGALWCAWAAWDGTAYQVFVCHATAGATWGEPALVSPAPTGSFHLTPAITATDGHAWVVWSRTTRWGQLNHRFNHIRSLHAAVVTPDAAGDLSIAPAPGQPALGEPGRLPVAAIPFRHSAEDEFINPQTPRIVLGPQGPVVFYRQFRSAAFKDFGWAISAVRHTGDDWTAPERLSTHSGVPDSPYGVIPTGAAGTSWLLAYHAGDYTRSPSHHPSHPVENHRLVVEQVRLTCQASAPPTERLPASAPAVLSSQHPARPAATAPARTATVNGQSYSLLFGDLHRHSVYSKCLSANDGDPLNHWQWVQDVAALDFYALTEHLEYMSYAEWRHVEDLAALLATGGVLALYGFELAIPPGHTNFFYADQAIGHDLRVACLSSPDLAAVWPKLDAWLPPGKVVAIRHHQGHRGDDLARTYGPAYEPVAEIIQTRGEYPQWVQSLWRQGLRVGVVGASDHSRAAPFVQGLTGLWLPAGERSREAVLAGLQARRTFATNGPRMSLFLSAMDAEHGTALAMGEQGNMSGPPRLHLAASGTRPLETVEFYRDDRLLHVETVSEPQVQLEYAPAPAPAGDHAYWVRVTQQPERNGTRPGQGIAYSSPLWLTTRH